MTDTWTVRVVVATGEHVSDAVLDRIADLGDQYDATVARHRDGTGVVMTFEVDHEAAVDAAIRARTLALDVVGSVSSAGDVVDLRVCTSEIYEAEALRPDGPELLAAGDVGEVLGVSRQRVHQLATENARFPAPYVRLSSGPVWARPAVEHFAAHWDRRPGRPTRKAV
ncbi:MAG TPA: hypothetical protein VF667_10000 [Pseudonocardia sp.]